MAWDGADVLLYGKKSFLAAPRRFAEQLQSIIARSAWPNLERAREWLVFAGQLEQAVLDTDGWPGVAAVTNHAAALFLGLRDGQAPPAARECLLTSLACAAAHLDGAEVAFRLPEGMAWYALYPDSYASTAERWAAANRGRRASVIGLRSIGTSLSAVVAQQLRRSGQPVTGRMTLRPSGHPFRRRADMPEGLRASDAFIIVDEGPGLSGSSMVAVAAALHAQGVSAENIIFFPGHGAGPGCEVGEEQRKWWGKARCWVTEAEDIRPRFDGVETLHVFAGYAAMCGAVRTMADAKSDRQARLAARGLALPCLGRGNGWITLENAGHPLTRADRGRAFTHHLAAYIRHAATPAEGTCDEGLDRIAAAIIAYADEGGTALGADGVHAIRDRLRGGLQASLLHGDGRLAPCEWLRLKDGRILKRNATGTELDHGWPGAQSVLWDVAGAAVEWQMPEDELAAFLHLTAVDQDPLAFAFHRAGYACFRLAQARQHGEMPEARLYEADLIATLRRLQRIAGWR